MKKKNETSKNVQSLQSISYSITEPAHNKPNKMTRTLSEDSDQPGHPPSLIRVFAVHMKKNVGSLASHKAHSKDWSDWADAQADLSLRWVHKSFSWFYHAAAHILQITQ